MRQMDKKKSRHIEPLATKMGRRAGVGLHFTSLPGPHGCGDIADTARTFIDQLAQMNIGVWQFLPTGPTAYGDSPYQPLSAFAGNAMLIGLDPLVRLGLLKTSDLAALTRLPHDRVDYDQVIPARSALLVKAAEQFHVSPPPGMQTAYEEFLHIQDGAWLNEYALYRSLKTLHGEQAWPQWDEPYRRREPVALRAAAVKHQATMDRIKFTQFLFCQQWGSLQRYAADKGICLFGDMPIYIALDSADAWAHPELLLLDDHGRPSFVAGVPPDYFSADGQLWGNPLYDWDYHRQTGYAWWIDRMRHASGQMSLVRIDHFRGLESFWSVPAGAKTARVGRWEPGPGDAFLDALHRSLDDLPIVAEDLGVITPEVRALRLRHGIPGMRVLQFEVGDPDFDPAAIESNCVCYTGTHDNDTTAGWFKGNRDDTRTAEQVLQDRANALRLTGGSAQTIHLDMIRLAFSSPAALAIAPMQDYLGLGSEARLNIPGNTHHNWRWRLRAGDLQPAVRDMVAEMAASTGRER